MFEQVRTSFHVLQKLSFWQKIHTFCTFWLTFKNSKWFLIILKKLCELATSFIIFNFCNSFWFGRYSRISEICQNGPGQNLYPIFGEFLGKKARETGFRRKRESCKDCRQVKFQMALTLHFSGFCRISYEFSNKTCQNCFSAKMGFQ